MRISLALFVSSLLISGTSFAFDDCSCTCQGTPMRSGVSDASRDGYFLQNGKVMVLRNGNISEITQETTFDNGMRIQQDGTVILADGTRQRLSDSQWLSMDGSFSDRNTIDRNFTAQNNRDGFFLQNGKVMQFRDGNVTEVTAEVSLSNGSRILPDGTLIMKDGTRSTITANKFVTMDGQTDFQSTRNPQDVRANRDSVPASHQERMDANRNNQNNNANRNIQNQNDANRNNLNNDSNRIDNRSNQSNQNHLNNADTNNTHGSPPTQGRADVKNNPPSSTTTTNQNSTDANNTHGSPPTQGRSDTSKNAPSNTTGNSGNGRGTTNNNDTDNTKK